MELLESIRTPCFSNTLQLAVEDTLKLPQVSHTLVRCWRLASFCKVFIFITEKQIDLHQEQLCLICDVQTRWNSAYYMTERIILMQQPLSVTLCAIRKGDLIPSDSTSFQNFLGSMSTDHLVLACYVCMCTLHTMWVSSSVSASAKKNSWLTITIDQPLTVSDCLITCLLHHL